MYQWSLEENQSAVSLSECSDHTAHTAAAAVIFSLKEELLELAHCQKEIISITTNSPTSQYRNQKMFWLIEQLAIENTVTIKWIFLEVGHGKRISNGLGAIVEAASRDLISFCPDMPIYSVYDLQKASLKNQLQSVHLYEHSADGIKLLREKMPTITHVSGTFKFHEVITRRATWLDTKMFYKNKEKVSICTKLLALNKKDDDSDKSDVAELSKEGGILLKDFLINKLLGFLCLAGR